MLVFLVLFAVDDLTRAETLFQKYKFADANALARKLLDSPQDSATKERLLRIAAFSDFYLDHKPAAATALEQLFVLNPNATIDVNRFPPQLVAFFDEQRTAAAAKQKPPEPKEPPPKKEPDPPPKEIKAAPTKLVEQPPPPPAQQPRKFKAVSLLPFGIGQLAQGDYVAGAMWMIATAACFAANLALYLVLMQGRGTDGLFDDPPRARALQLAQNISAGSLIIVGLFGWIDSMAWTPGRMAAKNVAVGASIGADTFRMSVAGQF